jgi:anti-sigma factor RsiW
VDLHELTAGYALDALDPEEQERYEAHLATCEPCRDELQGFWQVSAALGRAAGGLQPPASLRGRILEQAHSERPKVVPLRRRFTLPVLLPAAVAAAAAIAIGIWAVGLSRELDDAKHKVALLGPNAQVFERRPRARTTRSGSSRTACHSRRASSSGRVSRD